MPNSYLDTIFNFPAGSGLYLNTYFFVPGNPNYGTSLDWLELFQIVAPKIGPEQSASIFRQAGYMHSFTVNDVRGLYRKLMAAEVKSFPEAARYRSSRAAGSCMWPTRATSSWSW